MTASIPNAYGAPDQWDRRGLPGWTYRSQALFDLERSEVFLTHWQLAGHTADLPNPAIGLVLICWANGLL